MRKHVFSRPIIFSVISAVLFWSLSVLFVGFVSIANGASPVFTNNGTSSTNVYRGNTNILVLDITLPPVDSDTFLDGDGTTTTGTGAQESFISGSPLIVFPANVLCGDTNGTTAPAKLRTDSNANCSTIDGGIILGADNTGTTFDMGASISQVRFRDNSANSAWDNGEDIYLDVDDSERYNGDTLDAVTVRNGGTAVVADIALVKFWSETTSDNQFGVDDTVRDADCAWDGVDDWECDVNFSFETQQRVYVTMDIYASATLNRTIQMRVAAIFDSSTAGAFNTGDTGIFFSNGGVANTGNHDGPSGSIINASTRTIIASPTSPPAAPPPPSSDPTAPPAPPADPGLALDSQPPGSPSNVAASAGDGFVDLSWTPPLDVDFASVKIYRSTEAGVVGALLVEGFTGTTYKDTGLTNGVVYYYTLFAVDTAGNVSSASQQVSAMPQPPAPQQTVSEPVTPESGGEVSVTTSEGTTATVEIPQDAVVQPTDFTVEVLVAQDVYAANPLPQSFTSVGNIVYDMQAESAGQTVVNFSAPLMLQFTYTDAQTAALNEESLRLATFDEVKGVWHVLEDAVVDFAANTILYQTAHLTRFALVSPADVTPTAAPGGLAARLTENGGVELSWTNPPQEDFHHIRAYRSADPASQGDLVATNIIQSPFADTPGIGTFTYRVSGVDLAGNVSDPAAITVLVAEGAPGVVELPQEPKPQAATPEDAAVADGELVRAVDDVRVWIVRKFGSYTIIRHLVDPDVPLFYGHLGPNFWALIRPVDSLGGAKPAAWVRCGDCTGVDAIRVWEVNGDASRHWMNMSWEQFVVHTGNDSVFTQAAIFEINRAELAHYRIGPDVAFQTP